MRYRNGSRSRTGRDARRGRLRVRKWWVGLCLGLAVAGAGRPGPSAQEPAEAGTIERVAIPGTEVRFELTFVPGGRFAMGSEGTDARHEPDEVPAHLVEVADFWMGRREVTHDEFEPFRHRSLDGPATAYDGEPFAVDAVTRPSPPYEDPAHGMGKSGHPAVGMTRMAALRYARWLSEKTGRLFRLPTEAEWEHACRLGAADLPADGGVALAARAWSADDGTRAYREVGRKEPDALGLHDLLGNVAEWVLDTYEADSYAERAGDGAVLDPLVGEPPTGRGVVRGGSYLDPLAALRCADRLPEDARWKRRDPQIPKSRWWNTDAPHVGFRLVSPAEEYDLDRIRAYWRSVFGEQQEDS